MKHQFTNKGSTQPERRRLNPVATLLVIELVALVAFLGLFILLVRSAATQFGSAVVWVVLFSFLVAAAALAIVFTLVVFSVRRKARRSLELLSRRFPAADVIPAYWSAALLQPSFKRGTWLQGVGTRGFAVTMIATDDGISFWRPNASEPLERIGAGAIAEVKDITVEAPIGGRRVPALQVELLEPTDRLMKHVQVLPTDDIGTEIRDAERVKQLAAGIRKKIEL